MRNNYTGVLLGLAMPEMNWPSDSDWSTGPVGGTTTGRTDPAVELATQLQSLDLPGSSSEEEDGEGGRRSDGDFRKRGLLPGRP